MKLPVIKHLNTFIENNDEDYLVETIEVLEDLTELGSLKDEELDVIGELISNMYGALEESIRPVFQMTFCPTPEKRVRGPLEIHGVSIL